MIAYRCHDCCTTNEQCVASRHTRNDIALPPVSPLLSAPSFINFDNRNSFSPAGLDHTQYSVNDHTDHALVVSIPTEPGDYGNHDSDWTQKSETIPSTSNTSVSSVTSITVAAQANRRKRDRDPTLDLDRAESRLAKQRVIDRNRRSKESMLLSQLYDLVSDNYSTSTISTKLPNRITILELAVTRLKQLVPLSRMKESDKIINSNTNNPNNPLNTFINNMMTETKKLIANLNHNIKESVEARSPPIFRSYMESLEFDRAIYSTFFFSHRSILFLIDVQSGKLVDVNDEFRLRLGLKKIDLFNNGIILHPCLSSSLISYSNGNTNHNEINSSSVITYIKFLIEDDHCWNRFLQPLNLVEFCNGSKSFMQCKFAMRNAADQWIEGEMKYWLESKSSTNKSFLVFECWENESNNQLIPIS